MLLKGKCKARGFYHPLNDLDVPSKMDDHRVEQLAGKLKAGTISSTEKEELARGHIRLALNIVGRYLPRAPAKKDCLVAEALYGIAYAIKYSAERLYDLNFTAYCSSCIHRFVIKELIQGHMGAISSTQYSRLKKAGITPEPIKIEPLDEYECPDPNKLYIIETAIRDCIKDELERQIIERRLMGYNDAEIGRELGYSRFYIGEKRRAVAERFRCL